MSTYNQSPNSHVITDSAGLNKAVVDNTGALKTTATFSGSISIGNITIQDGNGNGPVTVIGTGVGLWALASAIVDAAGNQIGISTAPIRTDPTGTTVQPVSWSGAPTVTIQSNASVNLTQVAGSAVSLGQKVMASSFPVTFASDQSALPVSGTVAATQSGSWTVTANAGSGTFATQDKADGAPGTASQPSEAMQIAGWDGTHLRVLSTDNTGALNITGSITASNPSVGATGAAIPADATFIGASDGTDLQGLLVDGSGFLKVAQQGTVTVSGTVAATQSGTWNIATVTAVTAITNALPAGTNVIGHVITDTGSTTAVTGTVTVTGTVAATQSGTWNIGTVATITNPVTVTGTVIANIGTTGGLALDATVSALHVAQGSTTSGQSGDLIQGAVTTAAPTYTTAKTNPLSLQTDGSLRTAVTNTVTVTGTVTASNPSVSATGAPVPADATFVGASDGTNLQPLLVDGSGFLKVAQQGTVTVTGTVSATQGTSPWVVSLTSTTITGTVAVTQSGNWTTRIVGNAGVVLDAVLGATKPANVLQVGGNDGTNAFAMPLASGGGSIVVSGTVAATQSGTWNIATVTTVTAVTAITNALPAGSNNLGKIEITDGTNTAAVKAASTAAVATDPALVVSLNPLSQPRVVGFVMDSTGVQRTVSQVRINQSTSGAHTLVSASGSTVVYVLAYKFNVAAACNVNLQSHTTTSTNDGVWYCTANQGAVVPYCPEGWFKTVAGEALDINLSASQTVDGSVTYVQF